ncbi:phosphoenolpyruvate carboxykinase [GTP]-like [Mizuhopecten yessoensis]|uniref:phosphoenolpyruvate carboxykinase (GTP) n=1 Tax=Mizuhopecten yessoensis TaxID=6573 RepID=A0A210PLK0_MIZYE|nr:phosphoenolpyruvate carboxykinase [GTP]-like [Mizuhopecten yessoensis]OWF37378.1 Phosphoenolpyruvate carboxykinase [GTP] [Mizuhopecten yessoensis]
MFESYQEEVLEVHEIVVPHLGTLPILKGDFNLLGEKVKKFIGKYVQVCKPRALYICDGTQPEADEVTQKLVERGTLTQLTKYENCWLCRTDPADVARVESKTWIVTEDKYKTVPHVREGVKGILGQWQSPEGMEKEMSTRIPGCMAGRTMYVIPFSMGPIGGPISKIGVQLTDSNYVLLCMRIMTRVHHKIWEHIGNDDFVRCVHSMGCPRPVQRKVTNHWPCNPERIMIAHYPKDKLICSYGSGYGGNSLLGKKCFALRIASTMARDEGWLAEHMLIMGLTDKSGKEVFVAAAFPSACGKTNLAMLTPSIPGYKVRCVGDDIAWLKFDSEGVLRAINPENGFFGVAPGTNAKTNSNAMKSFEKNSIFTNVGMTRDGGFYWEGMEDEVEDKNIGITTWLNEKWHIGDPGKAAHPNSRFTCPASQCPIIHPKWEAPEGVPISAIIFGGRRPTGVPLVFETFSWEHGVMVGSCVKSETTAAAEHTGKNIMHDPMAMRPFMGYNFGHYLQHWLDLNKAPHKMPKIFHVNWFRVGERGQFLWPGFGDNIRVLDWIVRRCAGDESIAVRSPIGFLPKQGHLNVDGIEDFNWNELFSLPKHYWSDDARESRRFLEDQVGQDVPQEIWNQLNAQQTRIEKDL